MAEKAAFLAWVGHLGTGKTLVHLQTILGDDGVPKPADFEKDTPKACDTAEDFLDLLDDYVSCGRALIDRNRKKYEKRRADEQASTIPGVPTEAEAEAEQAREKPRRKAAQA